MKSAIANGKESKTSCQQSEQAKEDDRQKITPHHVEWNAVDCKNGSSMERNARMLWTMAECLCKIQKMAERWCMGKIFHMLSSDADMENLSIDSTMAKAHQSTNGGFKKGRKNPLEEHVED